VPRRRYLLAFSAAALAFIVAMAIAWQLAALSPRTRNAPERAPGEKTTIAVLPFAASGVGQEHFGEGMAEDIAAALANYQSLAVVAPNSSFRYRARGGDPMRAGKALGARYVLTGSVAHPAPNVRIAATLVDAASGAHVWSEEIDWPANGLSDVQFAIVDGIAQRLAAESDRVQGEGIRRTPLPSIASYDRYLLARHLLRRHGETDRPGAAVLAARQLLERAVAEQADFAPYYSALSETYRAAYAERMHDPALDNEFGSRVAIDRAAQLAGRAVSLDMESFQAWAQLGWVLRWRPPFEDSIAAFERARSLNPNVVDARAGEPLVFAGRAVEAVPIIERAMRLDPLASPETLASLGHAYYMVGDYGKAIDALTVCVQRAPTSAFCHRLLAAAYSQTGRQEEAVFQAAEAMRENPGWTIGAAVRASLYQRRADLDHLVTGYRKAGFPE
jgi:TolB-like protein/cytochrome c-type biogenesis protein CcmH/NrfG